MVNITLYKNREKLTGFSLVTGKIFSRLGLSANAWTVIALFFTLLTAYFLIKDQFGFALVTFIVAAFLDSVDGAVARFRKEASKLGAYYDTISDRYMEGIIALALLLIALPSFYLPSYFWVALYMFGSMTITYAKAAAKEKELSKTEIRGGLLERPERLILLAIGIMLANFSLTYFTYVIVLLAVLCNITAIQRFWIAVKSAKQ